MIVVSSLLDFISFFTGNSALTNHRVADLFTFDMDNEAGPTQVAFFMAMFLRVKSHTSQADTDGAIAFLTAFGWQLLRMRHEEPTHAQEMALERIRTVETMESKIKVEESTTTFAICPTCHYNHPPLRVERAVGADKSKPVYPITCSYTPPNAKEVCNTALLDHKGAPIRFTVYHHLKEFVARIHARADLEEEMDRFCLDCQEEPPEVMTDIRHADLVRQLEGHDGRLFVDKGDSDESRILLSVNMDGFRVEGTNLRGPHKSSTVISAAVLNLPGKIRYDSGVMHLVTVVPGEPTSEHFQQYLRPFVDELVDSYQVGTALSRTATRSKGRTSRVAVAAAVTDTPAGRTTTGQAAATSHHFCTACLCFHVTSLDRTDFENWEPRNDQETRIRANKEAS